MSFLQTRRGKKKPLEAAKQHARQVKLAVHEMGSFEDLINLDKAEEWLGEELKRKKPGTVLSYCHSVALFFDFLKSTKQKLVFKNYKCLSSLQQYAKDWRDLAASLQKEKKRAHVERKERGYCKLNRDNYVKPSRSSSKQDMYQLDGKLTSEIVIKTCYCINPI